jgi:hypothetical protein
LLRRKLINKAACENSRRRQEEKNPSRLSALVAKNLLRRKLINKTAGENTMWRQD